MSWDISLEKEKLMLDKIYIGNYTYNVNPMYAKAMGIIGLNEFLQNQRCSEVIPTLKEGIRNMELYPKVYKKMNPKNGWGDYDGALQFLKDILLNCKTHLDYTIKVY